MKTTKADFELFKEECDLWLDKLGLRGWEVYYEHKKLDRAVANCSWSIDDYSATIVLSTDFRDTPKTDDEVRIAAFHEICHIFMAPLSNEALKRFGSEDAIWQQEHRIIHTLERLVLDGQNKNAESSRPKGKG